MVDELVANLCSHTGRYIEIFAWDSLGWRGLIRANGNQRPSIAVTILKGPTLTNCLIVFISFSIISMSAPHVWVSGGRCSFLARKNKLHLVF